MGIETASCDLCKKDATDDFDIDYDGVTRCRKCFIKYELKTKKAERDKLIDWLEATHLKKVKDLDLEIEVLGNDLKNLSR